MFLSKRSVQAILDRRIDEVKEDYDEIYARYNAIDGTRPSNWEYERDLGDTLEVLSARLTELRAVRHALLGDATIPHAEARKA